MYAYQALLYQKRHVEEECIGANEGPLNKRMSINPIQCMCIKQPISFSVPETPR